MNSLTVNPSGTKSAGSAGTGTMTGSFVGDDVLNGGGRLAIVILIGSGTNVTFLAFVLCPRKTMINTNCTKKRRNKDDDNILNDLADVYSAYRQANEYGYR
jgi:hypothetical protein